MKNIFVFGIMFLILVSLANAHGIYLETPEKYVVTTKYSLITEEVDNSNRFPVSDYKRGYTYRATQDYLNRHKELEEKILRKDVVIELSEESYSYRYVPYLGDYDITRCYKNAPKGKLFYIRC